MSDTQFSSLSPNSSNDLEICNYYVEEIDYNDQETLSIITNTSVANLDDFEDLYKAKIDPFLSDFMKEENDDNCKQTWSEICQESYDMNVFFNHLDIENDLDDYTSVVTEGFEDNMATNLLDLDLSQISITHKLLSNKRALSPINNKDIHVIHVPSKQRRVEVSSHLRCDEWINKYHEHPDRFTLKASGTVDRRKTKHHKVLSECDPDVQVENIDSKRNQISIYLQKKPSLFQNTLLKFPYQKTNTPVSFSHKLQTININRSVIRKPFNNYNHSDIHVSKNIKLDSHEICITKTYLQDDINTNIISKDFSEIVEMPRIPPPLRMGKRVSRRGHRLSLWQFLLCILDSNKYRENSTGIKWVNRNNGVFHIIDSKQVATLWGQYKERREKMTYDSLARSLRHYYKKNLMAKINNRRLVYQIAQECVQWSSETFIKRNRE